MLTRHPFLKLVVWLFLFVPLVPASHGGTTFEVIQDLIPGPRTPSTGLVADADGTLYGTTEEGGSHGFGAFYKVSPSGDVTILHEFGESFPTKSDLCVGSDGWLYGTSKSGGTLNHGCIFRLSKTGDFQLLHQFNTSDLGIPIGKLIEANPGEFYGTVLSGDYLSRGVIYRVSSSKGFEILSSPVEGAFGPLALGNDGKLYGAANFGKLFRISTNGTNFEIIHSFPFSSGAYPPIGLPLTLASDGKFYGVTGSGGANGFGAFFSLGENGQVNTLYDFDSTADWINGGLVEGPDGLLYGTTFSKRFRISKNGLFEIIDVPLNHSGDYRYANVVFVGDASFITVVGDSYDENLRGGGIIKYSPLEGYQTIHRFGVGDGYGTPSRLHLASDGNLYANVNEGGAFANGAIVRIKPGAPADFSIASEHFASRFLSAYGLTEGPDKILYGLGVTNTILKAPLDGSPASVRNLESVEKPSFPFVRAADGRLYTLSRTTVDGPIRQIDTYYISRLDETEGAARLTTVHTFSGLAVTDAPFHLALGATGGLYGNAGRLLFRQAADGSYSALHTFPAEGNKVFLSNVCEGFDGAYYGLIYDGDDTSSRLKFIKVTASGKMIIVRQYPEYQDIPGVYNFGSFLKANDGNFYGLSHEGVIRLTPLGDITLVQSMIPGAVWNTHLALTGDGSIYGLTGVGGSANAGQLFRVVISPTQPVAKSSFTTAIVDSAGRHQGTLNLNVTKLGTVTGKYVTPIASLRFTGKVDPNGNLALSLGSRRYPQAPPLLVQIRIDTSVTPALLTAVVHRSDITPAETNHSFTVAADVSSLPVSVSAGRRTLRFAASADSGAPTGHSWASAIVTKSGFVRLSGKLADGGLLSSGFRLQQNGMGLLQVAYLKREPYGSIAGLLNFAPAEGGEPSGTLTWSRTFPTSFAAQTEAFLTPYQKPLSGQNVLTYGEPILDAAFMTSAGVDSLAGSFNVMKNDRAIPVAPNDLKLSLAINRGTGVFRGSFYPTQATGAPVKFTGVFDQTAQRGFGAFSSETFSGSVTLTPRQPQPEGE